jgi:2,3-bisphosphoglycerate-independent phosphoglycerate mutase
LKAIYVLLDGLGDLPHPALGGLTPLQAAHTPSLDYLTSMGSIGRVVSVGNGIAPQSDIAVFNMLSYDFKDVGYPGRGIIEAVGLGMKFKDGDLVLRGNFATLNEKGVITDRRAGRNIAHEEALDICKTLEENLKLRDNVMMQLQPSIGHRLIAKFSIPSRRLSANITNTDPAYDRVEGVGVARSVIDDEIQVCMPEEAGDSAAASAKAVNEFSNQTIRMLGDHPVNRRRIARGLNPMNAILLRDAGNHLPIVEPITKRFGLEFGAVVDMPVEIGISKILGMHFATAGNIDDYEAKARKCLDLIKKVDIVYVHIKGPDEFGHDGNALGKKQSIEEIDNLFIGTLLKGVDISSTLIVISGDHSTPCVRKAHTDDPIPVLFAGASAEKDSSTRFTEAEALKWGKGLLKGIEIVPMIVKSFSGAPA